MRGHVDEPVLAHHHPGAEVRHQGAQLLHAGRVRQRDQLRLEAAHLLGQLLHVPAGRQGDDAEGLRLLRHHGQRLDADAAGAPQDREPLQAGSSPGSPPLTCELVRPNRRSRDW